MPPNPGRPGPVSHGGTYLVLSPIEVEHASALFAASHGADAASLWTYLPYGPFESEQALRTWIEPHAGGEEPMLFTALEAGSGEPVGVFGVLNVVPNTYGWSWGISGSRRASNAHG